MLYSFAVAAYCRAVLLSFELVGGDITSAGWIRTGMECAISYVRMTAVELDCNVDAGH